MGTITLVYLPDGQYIQLPPVPRTWTDEATGVKGDALRARYVSADAGGMTAWARARPLFQAIPVTAQSIPASTWTAITGLSEIIDNWAGHSDTTNTGRYYVPATYSSSSDWYLCTGYIPFSSSDAAHVHIAGLRKNGGGTIIEGGKIPSGTGHAVDTMIVDLVQMSGGGGNDYVELVGWQNTGGAINTLVSTKSPSLTVRWVSLDTSAGTFPALPGTPHVWTDADQATADATGSSPAPGGVKVPLNRELRDVVNFLTFPPVARLTSQGGTQTIPSGSGTWTSVNFTATGKSVDSHGGWSSGNPSRYVCQRAGLYLVAGLLSISEGDGGSTNTGYRAARLLQTLAAGGTAQYAGWSCLPQTGTGSTGTAIYATALVRMAAGDYIELQGKTTQGSTTTTRTVNSSAGAASRLVAVWMAQ